MIIADVLAAGDPTVYDWIHKREEEKKISDKSRNGRPPSITEEDEIQIYLDNCPVHKSKLVKLWLSLHPKVKSRWMPPYSPNWNSQEPVLCYDLKKFLNNHKFTDGKQLAMQLSWFVRRLKPGSKKNVDSPIYDFRISADF